MKIALSSNGQNLDSHLEPHFSKCSYYLVIDPDDMNYNVFATNTAAFSSDSRIQKAQFLVSKGVNAVITGICEPHTMSTLLTAGIELYLGQTGTIEKVLERFKQGKLVPLQDTNLEPTSSTSIAASPRFSELGKDSSIGKKKAERRQNHLDQQKRSRYPTKNNGDELKSLKRKVDHMDRKVKKMMDGMYE